MAAPMRDRLIDAAYAAAKITRIEAGLIVDAVLAELGRVDAGTYSQVDSNLAGEEHKILHPGRSMTSHTWVSTFSVMQIRKVWLAVLAAIVSGGERGI